MTLELRSPTIDPDAAARARPLARAVLVARHGRARRREARVTGARTFSLALSIALASIGCELGPETTAERMDRHAEHGTRARDAVVRGDLAEARRAGRALVEATAPPELQGVRLEAMRDGARALASASDVQSAGLAIGTIARSCGECHAASSVRIDAPEPAVPGGTTARDRMRRHLWASDRMWDGLVEPDSGTFEAGASELARAPLYPSTLETAETVAPDVRAIADAVRARAEEARGATDTAARARIYGELLATCAGCHRRIGAVGPPGPVGL